jgi:hypothetical protein
LDQLIQDRKSHIPSYSRVFNLSISKTMKRVE